MNTTEKQPKKSKDPLDKRGGARPGGGRPKGSTNKLTATALLTELADCGLPFEQALAKNYLEAQSNKELRFKYDQLFLSKLLADQQHITIDETTTVENRQHAFLKALETIGTVALQQETVVQPTPLPYKGKE